MAIQVYLTCMEQTTVEQPAKQQPKPDLFFLVQRQLMLSSGDDPIQWVTQYADRARQLFEDTTTGLQGLVAQGKIEEAAKHLQNLLQKQDHALAA